MEENITAIAAFLESVPPYDHLAAEERTHVAETMRSNRYRPGELIYQVDEALGGVFIVKEGEVEVLDRHGVLVSLLTPRNSFGERGLLRDGRAASTARSTQDSLILQIPTSEFNRLLKGYQHFQRFFFRTDRPFTRSADIATQKVSDLIARPPLHCTPTTSVAQAARLMREHHVSSLGVVERDTERFVGIITMRDMTHRVLAEGRDSSLPVSEVMTPSPATLSPADLGSDILQLMLDRKVGHLPVVDHGRFVGMITQTDITRFQAISAAALVKDVSDARSVEEMAAASKRIPNLLVHLVASNHAHEVITRLITDITDTITRRLLAMAEEELGAPPVPYLWLACGSQGRQEQSGVSDQDNCLFLDDRVRPQDMPYFESLARRVVDGLNTCGYVYCPGNMMATNPRWCQPVHIWREYFHNWAVTHEPESHMLASVMFDLRPISGTASLYRNLQEETLLEASQNSIFVAHMISNSLKHVPPLGLLRGFSTQRSGPYRNHIDMKHNGVIPVTDLARVYALQGRITDVNTRARLTAAENVGIISASGARELMEAYDVIALLRLQNQATAVRYGRDPTNFLAPADLSDFERNHLRNAFVVVRTMQSAISHSAAQ